MALEQETKTVKSGSDFFEISKIQLDRLENTRRLSFDIHQIAQKIRQEVELTAAEYSNIYDLYEDIYGNVNNTHDSLRGIGSQLRDILSDLSGSNGALKSLIGSTRRLIQVNDDLNARRDSGALITDREAQALSRKLLAQKSSLEHLVSEKNLSQYIQQYTLAGLDDAKNLVDYHQKMNWIDQETADIARSILDSMELEIRLQRELNKERADSSIADQVVKSAGGGKGYGFKATLLRKFGATETADDMKEAQKRAAQAAKKAYRTALDSGVSEEEAYKEAQAAAKSILKDFSGAKVFTSAISKDLLSWATAATIAIKIWNAFKEVSTEAANVKNVIGTWEFSASAANWAFASSTDYLKSVRTLVTEVAANPIDIFSKEEIGRMAEAKNLMGLTDEQSARLAINSKAAGKNMYDWRFSLGEGIHQGMILNSTTVSQGQVMRDILGTSDAIVYSMGDNAERIGRAAVAARSLGLNLQEAQEISKNLLNFESSIESEMQAQLLTGHQLNLAKAREYALNNDLEGVMREIGRQGATIEEYGRMNYIQQENFARALGMSRDQFANMLKQQYLSGSLTREQLQTALKISDADMEAMGITEQWKVATDRLRQSVVPILNLMMPIVEYLSHALAWVGSLIGHVVSLGSAAKRTGAEVQGIIGGGTQEAGLGLGGKILALGMVVTVAGRVIARGFRAIRRSVIGVISVARGLTGAGAGMAASLRGIGAASTTAGRAGKVGGTGLRALGKALASFLNSVASGSAAIPVLATLAGTVLAVGGAIWMAGKGLKLVLEGLGSLITDVAAGFKTMFEAIHALDFADLGKLALLGAALVPFSLGLALSTPALLKFGLIGLPVLTKTSKAISRLSNAGSGLVTLKSGISSLIEPLNQLSDSLDKLDEDKLDSLGNLGGGRRGRIGTVVGRVQERRVAATRMAQESRQTSSANSDLARIESMLNKINSRLNETMKIQLTAGSWDVASRELSIGTV